MLPRASGADLRNTYLSVMLPVTGLTADILATAEAEDHELLPLGFANHFSFYVGAVKHRCTDLDGALVADEQDILEGYGRAGFGSVHEITRDHVSDAYGALLVSV